MKHLIHSKWDWKVRQISEFEFAVVFPSVESLDTWSKVGSVELALHSIKAKIEKSTIDPEASSILTAAWVKISGVPSQARTVEVVKEIASTVGDPVEVDELSLVRVEPVKVKVLSRDPSSINCFVEIFINKLGYELKFEAEGGGKDKKKGPVYDHFHKFHARRKDKDDEDDEEDYHNSDHRIEWEKMKEKIEGESKNSSDQPKGYLFTEARSSV